MPPPDAELETAARTAFASAFDGVIAIEPEGGPALFIDGRRTPPEIGAAPAGGATPDCVWRGERETILRALEEERAFAAAFVSGRLSVSGDMSVMARLTIASRHG